jgi:hypothetical protein
MTIQDELVAYKTYAKAEGKSPKTIDWFVSSMGYFAEFLGPRHQDIGMTKANDLRWFIIALQEKPKFSNHPYNKPQTAKLSAQSVADLLPGDKCFLCVSKARGVYQQQRHRQDKDTKDSGNGNPYFLGKRTSQAIMSTEYEDESRIQEPLYSPYYLADR